MTDLKKNLLSIRGLDNFGCKIHTKGEILKVMRGNMVVMKIKKVMTNLNMCFEIVIIRSI